MKFETPQIKHPLCYWDEHDAVARYVDKKTGEVYAQIVRSGDDVPMWRALSSTYVDRESAKAAIEEAPFHAIENGLPIWLHG